MSFEQAWLLWVCLSVDSRAFWIDAYRKSEKNLSQAQRTEFRETLMVAAGPHTFLKRKNVEQFLDQVLRTAVAYANGDYGKDADWSKPWD